MNSFRRVQLARLADFKASSNIRNLQVQAALVASEVEAALVPLELLGASVAWVVSVH